MDANKYQHGGDHYQKQTIQVWDFIEQNKIPYLEGNVIRYVSRWRDKGGFEDLLKARHYIEKLIEVEGKKPREERGKSDKDECIKESENFRDAKISPMFGTPEIRPNIADYKFAKESMQKMQEEERASKRPPLFGKKGVEDLAGRSLPGMKFRITTEELEKERSKNMRKTLKEHHNKAVDQMDDETVNFLHDTFTNWW